MTAGLLAGLRLDLKDYDSWADLFPLLPFAALGARRRRSPSSYAVSRRGRSGSSRPARRSACRRARRWSTRRRPRATTRSTRSGDAIGGRARPSCREDATITSIEAPQPLVLTGRTNPTRHQMFRGGLQDYVDDTWPGGLDGFERDLVADEPDLVAVGETRLADAGAASIEPDYVFVGRAPRLGLVRPRRRSARRRSSGCATPPATTRATPSPRRRTPPAMTASRTGRSAALAAGSVVSGLLAYVAVRPGHPRPRRRGGRTGLGAVDPVGVRRRRLHLPAAALDHPQRRRRPRGRRTPGGRPGGRCVVAAAALALGLLAWLLRDRLFHRDDAWFPVMVVLVTLGSAAVGVVRGGLAGRGRFAAVAWSLVAENAPALPPRRRAPARRRARPGGPRALPGRRRARRAVAVRVALRGGAVPAGPSALAFLGGAAPASSSRQAVLTGGPVLLALLGGSPVEVTAMFAALALFRAPYMVVLGTLPQLTQRRHRGTVVAGARRPPALAGARPGAAHRRRRPGGRGVRGAARPVAAAPGLRQHRRGRRRPVAAVLAAGCTLAVANLVLMVDALAGDRPLQVAAAWGGGGPRRRRARVVGAGRRCPR